MKLRTFCRASSTFASIVSFVEPKTCQFIAAIAHLYVIIIIIKIIIT